LRINNQVSVHQSHRQLGVNNDKTAEKVGRIGFARDGDTEDEAVNLSMSGIKRANSRGLTDASRKAQESVSLVQSADSKLQKAESILQRMQKLAAQSASITTGEDKRTSLDYEFTQYIFELCDLGTPRYDGVDPAKEEEPVMINIQVGDHAGAASEIKIDGINISALGSIGSADAAAEAVSAIDTAMRGISASRASLDEAQTKLISDFRSLDNSANTRQNPESRIRDADAARNMIENMRSSMLFGSPATEHAQANAVPQGVLQLLA
jgi:flagellin